MMKRPEAGSKWWMSATRPATEFSIGIMPRSASPEEIADSASSKVAQGIGSASGYASTMAMWELAPGSPWNAIFSLLILGLLVSPCLAAPCKSRSGFGKYPPRGFEVVGHVDAAGHGIDDGDVDAHAGLQRAELLQLLLHFQ